MATTEKTKDDPLWNLPERMGMWGRGMTAISRLEQVIAWGAYLVGRLPDAERAAVWAAIKRGESPLNYHEQREHGAHTQGRRRTKR